jgi:hypothetical protein
MISLNAEQRRDATPAPYLIPHAVPKSIAHAGD